MGFLLSDCGSGGHVTAVAYVLDQQSSQIASSELAVDGQVEQRKLARIRRHLESGADRPDFLELQGRLLARMLPFVPRNVRRGGGVSRVHDDLLLGEGRFSLRLL
ncbi:protein of unknown function (plasmid) [Cupriavidus taiwanensis]|uniref:Uncharacterized protein n=1 Tax=Cupriavidus taiwanensis TaxID=164546 RepID=A0A375INM3_9BURK|nr:protein of unknown function [Cupriavidus taiwanensis]